MTDSTENNNFNLTTPNATNILNSIRNDEDITQRAQMIEGENGRYAYTTTGNKNLDFFSKLARTSTKDEITRYFTAAYNEDKVTALQILMNYRDRNGKQEKNIGRVIMAFMKEHCPYTYMVNLLIFIENGYIKDLSELNLMTQNIENMTNQLNEIEADIYSKLLVADRTAFDGNEQISLAAKWAPRQQSKYDKLAKMIARKLPEMEDKNTKQQLKEYRKFYLSPLNQKLNTLERNMTSKDYEKITIEHVPATALKKSKKAIERNMPEKYQEYLTKCRSGEVKMKTTGIQPHELVREIEANNEASELQLNEIIRKLRESGIFENTLPVSDVSGSMSGVPMEVSVALGYVLSQLQNDEFKDKLITFSTNPQLHQLQGTTTKEKLNSIRRMDWAGGTDFIKVFEMLLADAKTRHITEAQMVKKIIVFTDMEFNSASGGAKKYETAFEEIKAMYESEGLTLPQIIFWNLRASTTSFPVRQDTPGVALMNGFSSEMLKIFMDDGEITPIEIMKKAISKYNVINLNEEIV
jgi:hypothetical protein